MGKLCKTCGQSKIPARKTTMALIKSTILAQISGSINGVTFASNRGGAYARNRSKPSNPETDRQDQVRTALSSLAKAWSTVLTPQQRELWRNYGANQTVRNRLGDQITLSGIAAYQRVNMFRMASLDELPLDSPPESGTSNEVPPAFGSATPNAVQTAGSPAEVDITLVAPANGYSLVVYYSGPLSPGIRYYRGPYIGRVVITGLGSNIPALAGLPNLLVPAAGSYNTALKIICYDVAASLPIWTVHTDPIEITKTP